MTAAVWVTVAELSASARAMPKSMTLTAPARVIITFAGLMSRWMIPLRWLKSSAPQTSAMISMARRGGSRPSVLRMSRSVRPSTYSMTMNGTAAAVGWADVVLAGVVDRDDRRVVQAGGRLRLAAEPVEEGRVAGQVGAQHLDRDVAAETDVAAAVDLGHAAVADELAELVPARRPGEAASSNEPHPVSRGMSLIVCSAAPRVGEVGLHDRLRQRRGRGAAGRSRCR